MHQRLYKAEADKIITNMNLRHSNFSYDTGENTELNHLLPLANVECILIRQLQNDNLNKIFKTALIIRKLCCT